MGLQPAPPEPPQSPLREVRTGPRQDDPHGIIDLTSDSSDESVDSVDQKPPSLEVTDGVRCTPVHPAEEPPTHSFSAGSPILGPALNLVKEPYDKPRLFTRYTLDFENHLVNISAHGFVDEIFIIPRW